MELEQLVGGGREKSDTASPVIAAKRTVEEIFLVFSKILAKTHFNIKKFTSQERQKGGEGSPPGSPTRTRGVTPVRFKFTFNCTKAQEK